MRKTRRKKQNLTRNSIFRHFWDLKSEHVQKNKPLLRPSWLASLVSQCIHEKLSKYPVSSSDVEELTKHMKELGVAKLCATVPCDIFAKALEPKTKDTENEVEFNLGRERKRGERMPLYFDSGIYIEHKEIFKSTKKNIRKEQE